MYSKFSVIGAVRDDSPADDDFLLYRHHYQRLKESTLRPIELRGHFLSETHVFSCFSAIWWDGW